MISWSRLYWFLNPPFGFSSTRHIRFVYLCPSSIQKYEQTQRPKAATLAFQKIFLNVILLILRSSICDFDFDSIPIILLASNRFLLKFPFPF